MAAMTAFPGEGDRHNFVIEDTVLGRAGGFGVRIDGEAVLLLPGDLVECLIVRFGQGSHGLVGEAVPEVIPLEMVEQLCGAVLVTVRLFGSRCGALVIDSCPPATTTWKMPARMSMSAITIESILGRHTLMTLTDTDIGRPAAVAARRAGI